MTDHKQKYRPITRSEQRVINALEKLAKNWPSHLMLFSWSGSLSLCRMNENGSKTIIADIDGIINDGGDPDSGYGNSQFHRLEGLDGGHHA